MKPVSYFLFIMAQSNLLLATYVSQDYVVPEPQFKVLSPRGFTVSIPDEEGIELFAFHGNVNVPMNGLAAGEFSKDILKKENQMWVYENHCAKLEEGDAIHFWLLVIRNKLGYRYDNGRFVVKDIVQKQPQDCSHASSNQPTTQSNSDDKTRGPVYSPMCKVALNLFNTQDQLRGDLKKIKEINDILKGIIGKEGESARTLRFEGVLPPFDDAQYTAQIILKEKLGVHISVVNATREIDNSIKFQVASLDDKIYVIRQAKDKLEKMNSNIILKY